MVKKLIKPGIKLARLESDIESGIGTVGRALTVIQSEQLYKSTNKTFEAYCKERWGFGRDYAYKLIKTEAFVERVSTMVDKPPTRERHVREVLKAPEKKQAAIVAAVQQQCEEEKREPTAKDYRAAAKPFVKETNDQPKSTPVEPESTPVDWKLVRKMAVHRANQCMRDIDDLWNVRASGNPARHDEAIKCIQRVIVLLGDWS